MTCEICGKKCSGIMTDRRVIVEQGTDRRVETAVERFCCKNHIATLFALIKKGQENLHEHHDSSRLDVH